MTFSEFLKDGKRVTLANGLEVEIPPLSWGVELRIFKILTESLNTLRTTKPAQNVENPEDLVDPDKAIQFLMEFPDAITDIAALIFRKDRGWVEKNLTSDDIVKYVLPLSLRLYARMSKNMTSSIVQMSTAMTEEMAEENETLKTQ